MSKKDKNRQFPPSSKRNRRLFPKRSAQSFYYRPERKTKSISSFNKQKWFTFKLSQPLSNQQYSILTIIKYLFTVILLVLLYTSGRDPIYVWIGLLELIGIALVTNVLIRWHKWLGLGIHYLLMLVLNAQLMVLFFGGSYISLVMVTNLESIEALSGSLSTYGAGSLLLLIFTFLPVKEFYFSRFSRGKAFSLILIAELSLTMLYGNLYSPLFALYRLAIDAQEYQMKLSEIAKQPNVTSEFYRSRISSAIDKPVQLPEQPNVVLIFVEGLSQNIIEDDRNIMPYMRQLQDSSLSFDGYYNHTFATYRGLIGQLYSGYQLDNYDSNSLVSMQDIFRENGYLTSFINTEPRNAQFTKYLDALNFEQLVTDPEKTYSGPGGTLSDKEAFEMLYETMVSQATEQRPFFTSIYTFGTHISLDSPDVKYKDGQNHLLNRFYNLDVQLQTFMEKVKASEVGQNTIFIFTTDHATYQDADFISTFPDYARVNPDVDRIPLFVYYNGVSPQKIEVNGRNSLDLAPTVFDYLDINAENYFLGASLFFPKENNNTYDTVFYDNSFMLSTDQEIIQPLPENIQLIIDDRLQKYFAAKTQMPLKP